MEVIILHFLSVSGSSLCLRQVIQDKMKAGVGQEPGPLVAVFSLRVNKRQK